jgi:hypothetical protein
MRLTCDRSASPTAKWWTSWGDAGDGVERQVLGFRKWKTKTGKANFIAPPCLSEDPDLPQRRDGALSVCLAKNSGPQRREVISHAVALAPFSQNSRGRGSPGLA